MFVVFDGLAGVVPPSDGQVGRCVPLPVRPAAPLSITKQKYMHLLELQTTYVFTGDVWQVAMWVDVRCHENTCCVRWTMLLK